MELMYKLTIWNSNFTSGGWHWYNSIILIPELMSDDYVR